jgi:hypothetical protein
MDKKTRVYIELTKEQTEKLAPLFDKVSEATLYRKPIMLLSQIMMTNDGEAVAVCNVTTHEEGIELQKVLNPKVVGKYVGDKYFRNALKRARATEL